MWIYSFPRQSTHIHRQWSDCKQTQKGADRGKYKISQLDKNEFVEKNPSMPGVNGIRQALPAFSETLFSFFRACQEQTDGTSPEPWQGQDLHPSMSRQDLWNQHKLNPRLRCLKSRGWLAPDRPGRLSRKPLLGSLGPSKRASANGWDKPRQWQARKPTHKINPGPRWLCWLKSQACCSNAEPRQRHSLACPCPPAARKAQSRKP